MKKESLLENKIKILENHLEKLEDIEALDYIKRCLTIKDKYCGLLYEMLCDYDGYYDEDTKSGDVVGLASLIDETLLTLDRIRDCDDISIIYEGYNSINNKHKAYNILMEEIQDDRSKD